MQDCEITVSNCPHLNQIENFENSFMVCTDCGLEVEQIYCNPPTTSNDEKWFNEKSFFKTYTNKQFDFIDNCVRRDKIPDSCAYEIYDHYLKIKSKTKQKTKLNEVADWTFFSCYITWIFRFKNDFCHVVFYDFFGK